MLGVGPAGPLGLGRAADGAHRVRDGAGNRALVESPGPEVRPIGRARDLEAGEAARTTEREALAVLVSVPGLGPVTLGRLLAWVGDPVRLLEVAASEGGGNVLRDVDREGDDRPRLDADVLDAILRVAADAPRVLDRIRAAGLIIVGLGDPAYPERLRHIDLPPHVLFVAGDPAVLLSARSVAVVGTRRPTEAGRRLAARIGSVLARNGACVVSGLAVGIDGAAHAAVVAEGGATVAVLGGGHGQLYPRAHEGLAAAIVEAGGAVVSENGPDVSPLPGTFPRRNRLISGLSEATVVIEAGPRSGALTTAAWALEQGRGCYLVPGAIDAPMSAGCLAFLREYPAEARIVAGIPQLLEDLRLLGESPAWAAQPGRGGRPTAGARSSPSATRPRAAGSAAVLASLGEAERRVAAGLVGGLATVDELVAAADLPVAAVLAALTLLEARGLVTGGYGRYRPAGGLAGG
jgi:DNA processing protein